MTRKLAALRNRVRSDDGSVLMLALIVLLVVGIIASAALSFAGSGLQEAPMLRDVRNASAYDQGAVEGAINAIRGSSTKGLVGKPCPDYTADAPSTDNKGATGHSYTVTCTPKQVLPGPNTQDVPDYAILALSTTPGEGIIQPAGSSNSLLAIDGGIYSNSDISVLSGAGNVHNFMSVNGTVTAHGTCTTSLITSTDPPISCSPSNPVLAAPNYQPGVDGITNTDGSSYSLQQLVADYDADPAPTCAPSGSRNVAVFHPGLYTVSPDKLFNANTNCTAGGATHFLNWYFEPGPYYFHYSGIWNVAGYDIVAGTPYTSNNWVSSDSAPTMGLGCDPALDGAQFEFGGSAQVAVPNGGGFEICGPRGAADSHNYNDVQHIALYGLSSLNSHVTNPTDAPPATLSPTAAPTSTTLPNFYANPAGGRTAGDALPFATAALVGNSPAILSYGAFTTVPDGATVKTVTVNVTHYEDTAGAVVRLKSDGDTTGTEFTVPPCTTGSLTTPCQTPVDVTAYFNPSNSRPTPWRNLNTLKIDYCAKQGNNGSCTGNNNGTSTGTSVVDGLSVAVTYQAPVLEAQSCSGSCTAWWNSTGNQNVFIHGTVFVPSAAMSVTVFNGNSASGSATIFGRGVVVRTLNAYVNASSTQTTSPFQLPSATPLGRRVLFTEYEDGDTSNPRLRACVLYTDHTVAGTALPGAKTDVLHWTVVKNGDVQNPACT